MTTDTVLPTSPSTKRRRSRRIRAILAGGLVLGVGAAVTLAVWNDSEFVTGTFTAGTFNLEGSTTDGTTFSEHPVGTPGALTFAVNPTSLSPGDVVYAPFALRLGANTTNNATVVVSVSGTTGVVTNLSYELVRSTSMTCAAGTVDSTGTSLIAAATAVTGVGAGTPSFALAKGSPVTAAGGTQYLCFKVTAGAGLAQGQTGAVTWQFTATSN